MQEQRRFTRLAAGAAAAIGLMLGTVAIGSAATAATNPFERGPDPTNASIEATTGPFATASVTVARGSVTGFGGGTITYPTSTSSGTFGAIVIVPGFTERASMLSWMGPRFASQGFVVFIIDTNSTFDNPSQRATELQNALNYVVTNGTVASRIDTNRLAVAGHSMGGGGTLEEATSHPNLKAAVPMMPWDMNNTNFSGDKVPTMVIASQNDNIAPVNTFAKPFYNSIPNASHKAYREIAGASHTVVTSPNTTVAKNFITWMKRYVDSDTRYEQFMCPVPTASTLSASQGTCPG
jgi:dienelactone hydrolase